MTDAANDSRRTEVRARQAWDCSERAEYVRFVRGAMAEFTEPLSLRASTEPVQACIRRLHGLRCRRVRCCWHPSLLPSALDHLRNATDATSGAPLLLAAPYGLTFGGASALTKWCKDHGLAWEMVPGTFWLPGTIGLAVYARDNGPLSLSSRLSLPFRGSEP
jgi:hypothetical protein